MEILLVEDDLEDAGLTIQALRQGQVPCRVTLARDGEEAFDILTRRGRFARAPRPDLILLDLQLPKKGGRELLGDIRGDPALTRTAVVVLTVSPTHEAILKQEHLRVESYLIKPVATDRFLAVVRSRRKDLLSVGSLPP